MAEGPRGVPNYIQTTREILIIIFNCQIVLKHETASQAEFLIRFLDKRLLFYKIVVANPRPYRNQDKPDHWI